MLQTYSFKLLLCLFFLSFKATALEVPRLNGPIMDQANVMSEENRQRLSSALKSLNQNSQIQIQILTLKSLGGEPIEEFSIKAVEKWKLGGQKKDQGALLLLAVNDRKMRIEVGDGLEGVIPDMVARRIIESMKPFFKSGDFDTGIYVGAASIARAAGVELGKVKLAGSHRSYRKNKSRNIVNLIIFILFILSMIFRSVFSRRGFSYYGGRSGWSGGGGSFSSGGGGWSGGGGSFSGGGGWSGGGGSFSGGGSSGSW